MFRARIGFAIGLLFVSPAFAFAQLRFTQPVADLGELRGGPVAQHRFDFVNDTATPIEMLDIRVGCGCLRPVVERRAYQPGEKGTLLMHIRTLGQPSGARTWQAFVKYRQGDKEGEKLLVLAAKIVNEVTVEPSIVAMSVETTLRQEVTFTDHRPLPTKLVAALASSPAIKVTTLPQGAGVTKIILEVSRSTMTAERQDETLNLYTDDPAYRHLQVPITLTKANRAEVAATPDKVELIGAGSQLVRLRGAGGQVVRIQKAQADHAAIECTWAAGPGTEATLKIRVNPSLLATPSASAQVRVELAEPAGATLTIPVQVRKES
jgi:hypothetical protein